MVWTMGHAYSTGLDNQATRIMVSLWCLPYITLGDLDLNLTMCSLVKLYPQDFDEGFGTDSRPGVCTSRD